MPNHSDPLDADANFALNANVEDARWLPEGSSALSIAGWCCPHASAAEFQGVEAVVEDRRAAWSPMHPRPDVQAHFGGRANALATGFALLIPAVEPRNRVELLAVDYSGKRYAFWARTAGGLPPGDPVVCHYRSWAALLDPDPSAPVGAGSTAHFSVILPVNNTAPEVLRASLNSVLAQLHPHWELCVAYDDSRDRPVAEVLRVAAAADHRVRLITSPSEAGPARAVNQALERVRGDFAVFLETEDLLRPHALALLAQQLRADPQCDAIYADEDEIDRDGGRVVPIFKPAFSPEYARGTAYIGHMLCVRTELVKAVGGFDPTFDGMHAEEFFLRLIERTGRIAHLPRVLNHRRPPADSDALTTTARGDIEQEFVLAVRAHLDRIGDPRVATALGGLRVRMSAPGADPAGPGTICGKPAALVRWQEGQQPLQVMTQTARDSSADVLVLAREGIEELAAEAAAELAALALRPDSGCVSPVLVARNGFVAESGCVVAGGKLVPVMQGFDPAGDGYQGSLRCNREVDAVSPTCVAIRREVALALATSAPSWLEFLRRCRAAGLFHRVCAGVRVQAPVDSGRWTVGGGQLTVDGGGIANCRLPNADCQTESRDALSGTGEAGGAKGEAQGADPELGTRNPEPGSTPQSHGDTETEGGQSTVDSGPPSLALRRAETVGSRGIVECRLPNADFRTRSREALSRKGEAGGAGAEPGTLDAEPDGGALTVAGGRSAVDGAAVTVNEFYNPHFRSEPADYRLARRPAHLERSREPFVFQLETPIDDVSRDGWLELRGWCFHLEGLPVRLLLRCGQLEWSIAVGEPRPDVAAVHPLFTNGACGFVQRIGVPAGVHELTLEAHTADERQVVLQRRIRVSSMVHWHRWRAAPARQLAFQLSASPAHSPTPLRTERWPDRRRGSAEPHISIVTPSFQQARFLPHTLASVLDQDVSCEYAVQDGGSTDGSREILQAHGPRLAAWASEPDEGQADAIAKGFQRTSGRPEDLMAWINSDDFYLPGALGYVADYFAAHPEVDVVYGHRVLVDEDSCEIGRWFLPPHDDAVLRLNDFVPQETLFWRRRLWDRVGGINPALKFAMDWDLLLRFQAAGAKIVRVPYFLACFRVHAAQKTTAQLSSVGQQEIDGLRRRTFGRALSPQEIEDDPRLVRYLKQSARIEWLWRTFGVRAG